MTEPRQPRVRVLQDAGVVAEVAAETIVQVARSAIAAHGCFSLALSGGSTPARLYARLAEDAYDHLVAWEAVRLFWGDERCVPPDDPASNYRLVEESGLLRRSLAGVHRMRGELPPEDGARQYEAELRELFGPRADDGGGAGSSPGHSNPPAGEDPAAGEGLPVPALDLVLLGLGEDAHTASLFPGSPVLAETTRWVSATGPYAGHRRITMTLPLLTAASRVLLLVTGAAKAPAAASLAAPAGDAPAARVLRGARRAIVLLDREAAGQLP